MTILIQKLDLRATIPIRHHRTDAGADLCALEGGFLLPGQRALVRTGLAMAIPEGYYGRVAPRSGLAVKSGVDVLAGVVDCGYMGEIKVALINLSDGPEDIFQWKAADKIAQIIIEKCEYAAFFEAAAPLVDTERGTGGFGSTSA